MDDRIKSLKILRRHIANILSPLLVARRLGAKVTSVIPADIEADDLVTSSLHERNQYRADVAAIAVHQNSHRDVLMSCWRPVHIGTGTDDRLDDL